MSVQKIQHQKDIDQLTESFKQKEVFNIYID